MYQHFKGDEFKSWIMKANSYGRNRIPFVFMIDFDFNKPFIKKVNKIEQSEMLYNFNGFTNSPDKNDILKTSIEIKSYPMEFSKYEAAFNYVQHNEYIGNSYLTNLTFPIKVELNSSLKEIYYGSFAKYKIWYQEHFVCFSPEIFVRIEDGFISSYRLL